MGRKESNQTNKQNKHRPFGLYNAPPKFILHSCAVHFITLGIKYAISAINLLRLEISFFVSCMHGSSWHYQVNGALLYLPICDLSRIKEFRNGNKVCKNLSGDMAHIVILKECGIQHLTSEGPLEVEHCSEITIGIFCIAIY